VLRRLGPRRPSVGKGGEEAARAPLLLRGHHTQSGTAVVMASGAQ
jgi:hypothetical protein